MAANNLAILIGRVGQDPEYKPEIGKGLTTFSMAVNNYKKETTWFNIELWGKSAELGINLIKKGALVSVEGTGVIDKWEKDGIKMSKYKVLGNSFQLLGGKDKTETVEEDFITEEEEPPPF